MVKRDPYFETMPVRQALVWATAVRRQLGRWEPLVAKHALMTLGPHMTPPPPVITTMRGEEYWQAETEHHLLLVAARNLMKAIALLDQPPAVDLGVYAGATTWDKFLAAPSWPTRRIMNSWRRSLASP